MSQIIVSQTSPILLIGGGDVDKTAFDTALALCSRVVAADGGADTALRFGCCPDAVIGDMDSLSQDARSRIGPHRLFPIAEQDSTDFDKALRSVAAPAVLGLGFLGRRLDHSLAALTVLARRADRRVVLVGPEDVVVIVPPRFDIDLPPGTRVSLWPLAPVRGTSTGLHWPIDGLTLRPDGTTGTSNHADGPVSLSVNAPSLVLLLPRSALASCWDALCSAPAQWPVRAGE